MLLTHAGFGSEDEPRWKTENQEAFYGVLDKCCGLPLLIGIAGATINEYGDQRQNEEQQDAWSIYHGKLNDGEKILVEGEAEEYGTLTSIVDRSLEVLDRRNDFKDVPRKYVEFFRGFSVLQRQQRVRGEALQKLWSLRTIHEAQKVAEKFCKVSLVQMTVERNTFIVQLHDSVLSIATEMVPESERKAWFKTLRENYIPREQVCNNHQDVNMVGTCTPNQGVTCASIDLNMLKEEGTSKTKALHHKPAIMSLVKKCLCLDNVRVSSKNGTSLVPVGNGENYSVAPVPQTDHNEKNGTVSKPSLPIDKVPWWNIKDDGYLHDNLCRILKEAGEFEELLWLLQSVQWIVIRLQHMGLHAVELDLEIGKDIARRDEFVNVDVMRFFDIVRMACRRSYGAVMNNPCEAWFQLYGRMLEHTESSTVTQSFVLDVKKYAPRPWIEPSIGMFQEAGGALLETIELKNSKKILSISPGTHEEGLMRILWRSTDGAEQVTEYDSVNGTKKTYRLGLDIMNDSETIIVNDQLSRECTCGAFSETSKVLVTVHGNGKVRVWDVVDSCRMTHSADYSEDMRESISGAGISGDGRTVVFGSTNGFVHVWDTNCRTGDENGIHHFHIGGEVEDVDVSFDGNRFVCISRQDQDVIQHSVHVWDRNSGDFLMLPSALRND